VIAFRIVQFKQNLRDDDVLVFASIKYAGMSIVIEASDNFCTMLHFIEFCFICATHIHFESIKMWYRLVSVIVQCRLVSCSGKGYFFED